MSSPDPAPEADPSAAAAADRERSAGRPADDADPVLDDMTPSPSDDELYRAVARVPTADEPRAAALRGGVLRRPGEGHIAGVCAALATAGGLPPRLVQLTAIGLLALGVGLPLYLLLALLLPRERVDGPEETHRIDVPLVALARLRPGRGDVLSALAVIPAAVAGYFWLVFVSFQEAAPLRLLIPIVAVAVAVLVWGAVRARRARSAYLFAELGRRAGVLDDAELARTVAELRRYAPRAWSNERPDRAAPAPAVPPARRSTRTRRASRLPRSASRPRPLGARAAAGAIGILLVVGTVAFILVALFPYLAPGLASTGTLPGIGRLGAAAAVTTVAAGALLIGIGIGRRRSLAISLVGVLAFATFAASVVWVRLTDDSDSSPLVVAVDAYAPGYVDACATDGPRRWNRTVVIDLSAMTDPAAQSPTPLERWRAENPGSDDDDAYLTMVIACSRAAGDVRVVLPPSAADVDIRSTLTSSMGEIDGDVPVSGTPASPLSPSVELTGSLGTGDLTFTRESA